MLKSKPLSRRASILARAGIGSAAVAALLSLALAPAAQAGHPSTPHPFKDASISWNPGGAGRPSAPQILVGHDGQNYTHLVGEVSTRFHIKASVKSNHRIYGWTVTTGDPTFTTQLPGDLQGARDGTYKKSVDQNATFTMDAEMLVNSGIPGISLTRVQDIVDMCNAAFDTPPPTDRGAGTIDLTVHAGFSAGPWKGAQFVSWTGWYPDGATSRPAIAHTTFPANVVCLNRTDPRVGELPDPKPANVDIRVKQTGDTCPNDTEVTAYIDYDEPATARFRVIHNGKEPKSKPIEIKARKVSFAGKTWYRVERLERYKLDSGKHTFQIKVLGKKPIGASTSPKKTITVDCPPFQPTSMWLTLKKADKLTCPKKVDAEVRVNGNGPGSVLTRIKNQAGVVMAIESIKVKREGDQYIGRLTKSFNMTAIDTMLIAEDANNSAHNSGWQTLKIECLEVMSGTLDLRGFKASRCEGEAAFSIRTNMPGDVPYRLDCTGGRSWSGKAQVKKTGPNTYIGVATKMFDVSNNEQVNCALKTDKPIPYKVLALKGRKYACHKTTGAGGTDDLKPETRPEEPVPGGKKLTGDFSFIDKGGTKCTREVKALINFELGKKQNVHYSLDCTNGHFSGVAQAVPHPKGGFIAPAVARFDIDKTTHVKCALKTVAPGKARVHTLKGRLFRCVKTTGIGGANDLKPETRPTPKAPGGPGRLVPPRRTNGAKKDDAPKRVSCAKGRVKLGKCVCEKGFRPVKAGKNAWRCVKKVPQRVKGKKPNSGPKRTGGTRKAPKKQLKAIQRRMKKSN